jgi:hypothetical protein
VVLLGSWLLVVLFGNWLLVVLLGNWLFVVHMLWLLEVLDWGLVALSCCWLFNLLWLGWGLSLDLRLGADLTG